MEKEERYSFCLECGRDKDGASCLSCPYVDLPSLSPPHGDKKIFK